MLTQCPSCQTVFRVTGAILKMGHGQVRCGKCRTQFDALEHMLDDEDEAIPERSSFQSDSHTNSQADADRALEQDALNDGASASPTDNSIEAREPEFAEDVTLEGSRIEISGTYRIQPGDLSGHGADRVMHEHTVIEREPSAASIDEDIEIELSSDSLQDEPLVEQLLDPTMDDGEPVDAAAHHLLDDVDDGHYSSNQNSGHQYSSNQVSREQALTTAVTADAVAHKPLSQRIWGRNRAHAAAHGKIAAELAALTSGTLDAPRIEPRHTRRWIVASVVLLLALALQTMHHNRDWLVRNPKLGPTVTRIYHSLGLTLQPQWDLSAYELQQWGVITDPVVPDTLRVRASITNRATFSQPLPLVKLALHDRWGAPVGVRAFEPHEYLPGDAVSNRLLAPKQRTNAEIVIADPGSDAVGFQIYACLQYPQGMICSDDVPRAQ